MRRIVLVVCVLWLLPFVDAVAEPGGSRARHQQEWDSKAKKMERHPLRMMRKHGVDWSIEYSTSLDPPEWGGQRISMLREEDACVDEKGVVRYFAGPQEALWLIRSER